ncbi:MAG: right-handed parallel beta-helix repeat-containing protein, partial [Planctomycetes bacterium]|nr:right-handed parallel beta-helix repeat-containing protein [Planctomycetota bacterium]
MALASRWRRWFGGNSRSEESRRPPRRLQPRLRTCLAVQPLEDRRLLSVNAPVGPEFQVNTFTEGYQRYPDIARNGAGDFVIAWTSQNQDGSSDGVYAQRYNAAGERQGPEFQVNTFVTSAQSRPTVAVAASGEFLIAWESFLQDGLPWGIYAQRYDAAGMPQGDEFRVNTKTDSSQRFPSVAMSASGRFVVVWQSDAQDDSGFGIYAQRYSADGMPEGGEFRANTFQSHDQAFPSVAMNDQGFVIAWQSEFQDGSGAGTYAQRYDAAGVPQGEEFLVNASTVNDQSSPAIAMGEDGGFVVTWVSSQQDGGSFDVYARRFNALGEPQESEFRVNTFAANSQTAADVAIDPSGNFVVAWQSNGQDGSDQGIYAQQYTSAGATQGGELQINAFTTGDQLFPTVAMDAAAGFVVAWQSTGQDGSSDGIFAQRFAQPGVVWNTNDSGPGSLRQAILDANASPGADTIVFNIPPTDPNFLDVDAALPGGDAEPDAFVITPLSALPALTDATIIDGRTQTAFGGDTNPFGPEIVLDGDGLSATGLDIRADNSGVYGLNIQRFGSSGINIENFGYVTVAGNYIGVDATGSFAAGNDGPGVRIANATNVTVGGGSEADRNLISGNGAQGVAIIGGGSIWNVVAGNWIGINAAGTAEIGNGSQGVLISGAASNRIGADGFSANALAEGNVISGNSQNGVWITGALATGNVVAGNLIGTDAAGNAAIGNIAHGVFIDGGASENLIGTDGDGVNDAAERNVISGNFLHGVLIRGEFTTRNAVAGNLIGTDVAGIGPLG